ncbi:MAG: DinB family protein [Candidatus Sifarchaeia archaeon]|jgi:uncharacterized damage-inducible protein DinB
MFRRIDDFFQNYKNLTKGTLKIFEVLTDETLEQPVKDSHRTLGQIAWHIVTTIPELMNHTDLKIYSIAPDSPRLNSASEISTCYRKVTDELKHVVGTNWTDKTLAQTDDMYGDQWTRGFTLTALINHEIHHRGQITILLYQAGHKVPCVIMFPFRSHEGFFV